MPRLFSTNEQIDRARALIQKARDFPVQAGLGWEEFVYVARVKDLLRQARDLIKFIRYSPGATPEIRDEVAKTFIEIDQAEKEILHK
jgi:hypothetical protein